MNNKSFDTICKERGYEIERCPKTWSMHNYRETVSYISGSKKYTTIKCDDCGAESTAWERI